MTYKRIIHNDKPHYGKHIIINATGCNDSLFDLEKVRALCADLPERIDMKPYGPAYAFRFGVGKEEGISAFQLIYTSNIAIHTNDMGRDLYMDVFSCKDFDENMIIEFLKERMGPTKINFEVFYRE